MELKYFDLSEFKCKCGKCNGYPLNGMSEILLLKLDELREKIGRPIHVSSGYRCKVWNESCGGVRDSQHVLGKAADIWVDGYSSYRLGGICEEIFDGVGIYIDDDFVHVDMRDDGKSVGKYTWYE